MTNKISRVELARLKSKVAAILTAPAAKRGEYQSKADSFAKLLLHRYRVSEKTHHIDFQTGEIKKK